MLHLAASSTDDLQWADSGSLTLLHLLLTQDDNAHLLLIGAYRSNEVDRSVKNRRFLLRFRCVTVCADVFFVLLA